MNEWEAAVIVAQNDSDVRVALCIFATPLAVSESELSLQNTANQTNDHIYISLAMHSLATNYNSKNCCLLLIC